MIIFNLEVNFVLWFQKLCREVQFNFFIQFPVIISTLKIHFLVSSFSWWLFLWLSYIYYILLKSFVTISLHFLVFSLSWWLFCDCHISVIFCWSHLWLSYFGLKEEKYTLVFIQYEPNFQVLDSEMHANRATNMSSSKMWNLINLLAIWKAYWGCRLQDGNTDGLW